MLKVSSTNDSVMFHIIRSMHHRTAAYLETCHFLYRHGFFCLLCDFRTFPLSSSNSRTSILHSHFGNSPLLYQWLPTALEFSTQCKPPRILQQTPRWHMPLTYITNNATKMQRNNKLQPSYRLLQTVLSKAKFSR